MTSRILNDWIPVATAEEHTTRIVPLRVEPGATPQQRSAHAEHLMRRARRAYRRVRDALDLARLQHGQPLPLDPHPTDLRAICKAALDDARATAPWREFVHRHLGDGAGVWDGDRLTRALAILLEHAHAYAPSHTPVRLRWAAVGDLANVFVERAAARDASPTLGLEWGREHRAAPGAHADRFPIRLARQIALEHGGSLTGIATPTGASYRITLPRAAGKDR